MGAKANRTTPPDPSNSLTNSEGRITFVRPPNYPGNITAYKKGYQRSSKKWPLADGDTTIPMPPRKPPPTYAIAGTKCVTYRPVYETSIRSDGRQYATAHIVAETPDCDETGRVNLWLPIRSAPPGFRYRLVHVERWYDADRDKIAHRPWYALVPILQPAYQFAAPCGCQ